MIGDLQLGLEVRTSMQSPPVRHIGILGLHHDDLDQKDVVTTSLDIINMATVGYLTARQGAKTTIEPLLLSSTSAAPLPAERFNGLTDPATLRDGFKPTGTRYALALENNYDIAIARYNLDIADTDLLMDYMWVQTRELFGQRVAQAFANNGDLVANILDNLSGSSALISIRGRASFSRPFERVEALRRQADDRLRSKATELQSELQSTEAKLTELQSKRNDQSSLMLSPEQEQEIKRFTAEKAQIRKELRETQRGLNVDIDRLDNTLKIINIAVAPLIVAVVGGIVLAARRRRKSRGSPQTRAALGESSSP